ncbi:MAG TPA: hypothetical protein O0X23_00205 [Methanocorpusculum sp.]|nr:hypothetical protein [Methanocorpusculum sp.]
MAIVEIQLNRLGINSLELSTDSVDVRAGTALHVRFVNHGSPTHATLRCETSAYTDFTYENIYVESESELEIKIKEGAGTGNFDMQVITGYGMRRGALTINVLEPCPTPSSEPAIFPGGLAAEPTKRNISLNAGAGRAVPILIMPIIAAIIIVLGQFCYHIDGPSMAITIIVYLVMLAGVVVAWRSAP